MDQDKVLEKLKQYFVTAGFNLTLVIDPVEYDKSPGVNKKIESIFPGAKSVILSGFGGNSFWEIFQKYIHDNPEFKSRHIDLIDNYSNLKFGEAAQILDSNRISFKTVYPFGETALDLNFMKLGELGGAGVKSLLGILLHPTYGPWISLRGAFITDMELENFNRPLYDFSPCLSCIKPCISACPAQTISDSGWDWESCMRFRLSDETCATSCASRRACPYGKDVQYSPEQMEYHHRFVLKSVKEYIK